MDDLDISMFFELRVDNRTRGHKWKLDKPRVNTIIRQNSFSQRVINSWNSLPADAVNCITINSFKTALENA
jgi:hypothetical protein